MLRLGLGGFLRRDALAALGDLASTVVEIHGLSFGGCAGVVLDPGVRAGGVDDDDCGIGGEDVVFEEDVVSVGSEGDGFFWAMLAELEDVIPDENRAVAAMGFVEGEIEFGKSSWRSCLVGDPAGAWVGRIFRRVVEEDVSCHDEVGGLVDPCAATAISECVPGEGDVCAAFFDADDSASVGSVDEISGDDGVLAIFGEEEGAHAATEDVVVGEEDVFGALDVHGVTEGAEAAS